MFGNITGEYIAEYRPRVRTRGRQPPSQPQESGRLDAALDRLERLLEAYEARLQCAATTAAQTQTPSTQTPSTQAPSTQTPLPSAPPSPLVAAVATLLCSPPSSPQLSDKPSTSDAGTQEPPSPPKLAMRREPPSTEDFLSELQKRISSRDELNEVK